ncbi:hypothetical protein ACVFVO_20680 [Advenella kashmirensis]
MNDSLPYPGKPGRAVLFHPCISGRGPMRTLAACPAFAASHYRHKKQKRH